jgi:hypothetical protein
MGVDRTTVDRLEAGLVQGLHVLVMVVLLLLVLLHKHHFDALGFLAVVSKLIREASLNGHDRLSIQILHHLLADPLVASTALAALLDQGTDNDKSNYRQGNLKQPATRAAMVPSVRLLVEFFIIPRFSRLGRVFGLYSHLVSKNWRLSPKAEHDSWSVLAQDRVILLLTVSISVNSNRLVGRESIAALARLVSSLMMVASFVVRGSLMAFMTMYRMISLSL